MTFPYWFFLLLSSQLHTTFHISLALLIFLRASVSRNDDKILSSGKIASFWRGICMLQHCSVLTPASVCGADSHIATDFIIYFKCKAFPLKCHEYPELYSVNHLCTIPYIVIYKFLFIYFLKKHDNLKLSLFPLARISA